MNNFDRYKMLEDAVPANITSVPSEFVLHKDGALRVVWAPCDYINTGARIAIVGITPGWQQAQIAYTEAQQALKDGLSYPEACNRAKGQAAFAGTMRKNLIAMLDDIGVGQALGIPSTVELFGRSHSDLHSTSALRYPVFRDNKNYTGHVPNPLKHHYLLSMIETLLTEELTAVSPALVVPLGKAANACVQHAISICQANVSILDMFPHPSGANGHRMRQFKERKKTLLGIVENWQAQANASDTKSRRAH
ncbi:MAG: hypothetical protein SWH78_04195 [Thermodesulfobacteriota bacterium]|nr:hypothetical protein [Thermodesulfobacteriota bacterium]